MEQAPLIRSPLTPGRAGAAGPSPRSTLSAIAFPAALTLLATVAAIPACAAEPDDCTPGSGRTCVVAGTGQLGFDGDGRDALDTRFYWPIDLEIGPDGSSWVLDWNNHAVRRIDVDGIVHTIVGSFIGDGAPDGADLRAPGAVGTEVSLNHPTDIQLLPDGTALFASWHNHKLRRIVGDRVYVECGGSPGFAGDGGPAGGSRFNQPKAIVVAPDGSTYVLDQRNQRVRRIGPGPNPTIETIAGTGEAGYSGDGGPPALAQLRFETGSNPEPSGALALAPDGRLFIADGLNHRIRVVDFTADVIETIGGTGEAGFSGDGGPASEALIDNVRDLELGPDGNLYLADSENHRVRMIDLSTGIIDTVVGTGVAGAGRSGMPAREMALSRPMGIAFGPDGALYVADTFNSRIVRVQP